MDLKGPFEDKARIDRLCEAAPDHFAFMEFGYRLGMQRRLSEAEIMVGQTLRAIKVNIEAGNGAYSFKGANVNASGHDGLVDNSSAFGFLVSKGFFVLKKVPVGEVVKPPTDVQSVDGFYTVIQMSGALADLIGEHLKV